MSAVPPALDEALETLSEARSDPENLRLFDALHFLREALRAGGDGAGECDALNRVHRAAPHPLAEAVLLALGHTADPPPRDPLAPLMEAAGLPVGEPEPLAALEAWARRQNLSLQAHRERLVHADRIVRRAQQSTQLGAAVIVVLLLVVVLLLLLEGDWLEVPTPARDEPEQLPEPTLDRGEERP